MEKKDIIERTNSMHKPKSWKEIERHWTEATFVILGTQHTMEIPLLTKKIWENLLRGTTIYLNKCAIMWYVDSAMTHVSL